MQKKLAERAKQLGVKRIAIVILAVAIILVVVVQALTPKRSVEAYCKIYKEENAKITARDKANGKAISSNGVSNAGEYAEIYSKLERVAPDDIRPDTKVVRQIFEKIESDPSQAIGASLSGVGAQDNVNKWTNTNCSRR